MKKILVLLFALLPNIAQADTIIGFKGKNNAFDHQAFEKYAAKRKLTPVVLSAFDSKNAMHIIRINSTYELYGYSLGAASVAQTMRLIEKEKLHMPRYVITVGAYRTTNVDFNKYNVKFDNYFDASGAGTKSPGKHLGVSHSDIMRYVVDTFY